jgi:hypothetical protein
VSSFTGWTAALVAILTTSGLVLAPIARAAALRLLLKARPGCTVKEASNALAKVTWAHRASGHQHDWPARASAELEPPVRSSSWLSFRRRKDP